MSIQGDVEMDSLDGISFFYLIRILVSDEYINVWMEIYTIIYVAYMEPEIVLNGVFKRYPERLFEFYFS